VERLVPVRELNQRTSAVLSEVARGAAVTITSGGRPVARLVPLTGDVQTLDRLVAAGRAVAATVTGPVGLPPLRGDQEVDVLAALAADRDLEPW